MPEWHMLWCLWFVSLQCLKAQEAVVAMLLLTCDAFPARRLFLGIPQVQCLHMQLFSLHTQLALAECAVISWGLMTDTFWDCSALQITCCCFSSQVCITLASMKNSCHLWQHLLAVHGRAYQQKQSAIRSTVLKQRHQQGTFQWHINLAVDLLAAIESGSVMKSRSATRHEVTHLLGSEAAVWVILYQAQHQLLCFWRQCMPPAYQSWYAHKRNMRIKTMVPVWDTGLIWHVPKQQPRGADDESSTCIVFLARGHST